MGMGLAFRRWIAQLMLIGMRSGKCVYPEGGRGWMVNRRGFGGVDKEAPRSRLLVDDTLLSCFGLYPLESRLA